MNSQEAQAEVSKKVHKMCTFWMFDYLWHYQSLDTVPFKLVL